MTPIQDDLSPAQRERRQRILDAAVEVAASGGYRMVHMREIAVQAGVSLGTLYHYFPSKVHLLMTALGDELTAFEDHVDEWLEGVSDPFLRLRLAVSRLITAMDRSDRFTEALTHAYSTSYVVAVDRAQTVHNQTRTMFARLMVDDKPDERIGQFAEILAAVWTSEILALVQGRRTSADLRRHLFTTIDLLDRGSSRLTAV